MRELYSSMRELYSSMRELYSSMRELYSQCAGALFSVCVSILSVRCVLDPRTLLRHARNDCHCTNNVDSMATAVGALPGWVGWVYRVVVPVRAIPTAPPGNPMFLQWLSLPACLTLGLSQGPSQGPLPGSSQGPSRVHIQGPSQGPLQCLQCLQGLTGPYRPY